MQTRKIFFTLSVAMLILTAMNLQVFPRQIVGALSGESGPITRNTQFRLTFLSHLKSCWNPSFPYGVTGPDKT